MGETERDHRRPLIASARWSAVLAFSSSILLFSDWFRGHSITDRVSAFDEAASAGEPAVGGVIPTRRSSHSQRHIPGLSKGCLGVLDGYSLSGPICYSVIGWRRQLSGRRRACRRPCPFPSVSLDQRSQGLPRLCRLCQPRERWHPSRRGGHREHSGHW